MSRRRWRGNIALGRGKFFLLVLDPAPHLQIAWQCLRTKGLVAPANLNMLVRLAPLRAWPLL
jgi:hypothetical protein